MENFKPENWRVRNGGGGEHEFDENICVWKPTDELDDAQIQAGIGNGME